MSKYFAYAALVVVLVSLDEANAHGRLMKPASRSSLWRDPEFRGQNPPQNYDDSGVRCGGQFQDENPGIQCGVCGDPLENAVPRDNEVGGRWYRGIITGNYSSGDVIEIAVELTMAHLGFMEWRLCTDFQNENQNCFDQHLLQKADGTGSKVPVTSTGFYSTNLRLPAGVSCSHCVIQWNYRAGNNWGMCKDGSGAIGCGPQETFRGCSDVSIV